MDFLKKIPIGQYVFGSSSWLRRIDPRIKFGWVLFFLISPILSGLFWRVGLVLALLIITFFSFLSPRIWWRPLLYLAIFSTCVGTLSMFLPTSEVFSELQIRSPQELPNAITSGPSWELIKIGPLQLGSFNLGTLLIDRGSAGLGIKTSTLIFTVVHSVNLLLITTSPEDLMWTLQWFFSPLALIGFPVDRISFQLLLALRFIPLIQEEFQNLLRAIATRSINYRSLGFKPFVSLLLSVGERLLANILLRAQEGADALLVRNNGLILNPQEFRPESISNRTNYFMNSLALIFLFLVLFLRKSYGEL